MFHKSCPLCRHSIYSNASKNSDEDKLSDSNKFEIINLEEETLSEIENDNIMKQRLMSCIDYLQNEVN